jgi:hypothetical protein
LGALVWSFGLLPIFTVQESSGPDAANYGDEQIAAIWTTIIPRFARWEPRRWPFEVFASCKKRLVASLALVMSFRMPFYQIP